MRKYRNGRQNASSFRASIVTADRVPDATGWSTTAADIVQDAARWSTPTADRVLGTIAEILSRPTEYQLHQRKYSHGRHGTSAICANTVTADRVRDAAGWSTTTADRVPDALE